MIRLSHLGAGLWQFQVGDTAAATLLCTLLPYQIHQDLFWLILLSHKVLCCWLATIDCLFVYGFIQLPAVAADSCQAGEHV